MRVRVTGRLILLALAAILFAGLAILWVERLSIARRFADAELAARKVEARYRLIRVGPRTQRLENLVVGDPRNPDLVARWAEIELSGGWSGVRVSAVRAGGVRLRGRVSESRVSFGAFDGLLPKPAEGPFRMPDIAFDLADVQIRLDTPQGEIFLDLSGRGNPAERFGGRVALAAPRLAAGGAEARSLAARLDVQTDAGALTATGPVSLAAASGNGLSIAEVSGRIALETAADLASPRGNFQLEGRRINLPGAGVERMVADGRFSGERAEAFSAAATLRLAGLVPDRATARRFVSAIPRARGFPVEPLSRQLRTAIAALDRGSNASAELALLWGYRGSRTLRIAPVIRSASGAWLRGSDEGVGLDLRTGRVTVNDRILLSGGGFPELSVRIASTGGGFAGEAAMKPYRAGDARLALDPARFALRRGALSMTTRAHVDGPLGGGRIEGLSIPLAISPRAAPLRGCIEPSFRRVIFEGLSLSGASVRTCLTPGSVRIAPLRLAGRLGEAPLSLTMSGARFDPESGGFAVDRPAARLGPANAHSWIEADSISGRGAQGRFEGLSGRLANVALLASGGSGDWTVDNGVLGIEGRLSLADAAADARFFPLRAENVRLSLGNRRLEVTATLKEPRSGIAVASLRVGHRFAEGSGNAVIAVDGLTFDDRLQPEMVTPVTLGVIANVAGRIDGHASVQWSPRGVQSTGRFRSTGLDFAAAFGPVSRLRGEISLSDLLGLEASDEQRIEVGEINPGIPVIDGEIRYRLLPGLKAAVEGGRWPFAGGMLILDPTVLDLSASAERRLTFRVEGLDAARFIAEMQFENVSATGTFDGVLPMVFDQNGGRIVGGEIVARGGGTLSYIGEVSYQNLGTLGSFAFDALKSMKYDRLTIGLDGPLDGDVVTRIALKGVNQAPLAAPRTRLPVPVRISGVDNLPFLFNITITAPFRRLFRMAQTISDPSLLIEQITPGLERSGPAKILPPADKAVQPSESTQ